MITKEQLLGLGLTDEQATKVIEVHDSELKDKYVPIHRFNEVNDSVKLLKEDISTRDKQISDLKKFEGTSEELSTKIKELQDENKVAKENYENKLKTTIRENAVRLELLKDTKHVPHNVDKVFKEFNLDDIVVGEDGKIEKGFKEQFENLLKTDSYLFKTVEPKTDPLDNTVGWKPVGTDPQSGGTGGKVVDPATELAKRLAKEY